MHESVVHSKGLWGSEGKKHSSTSHRASERRKLLLMYSSHCAV